MLLPEPARLVELEVRAGQRVSKGQILGRFKSDQLEIEMSKAKATGGYQRAAADEFKRQVAAARSRGDKAAEISARTQEQEAEAKANGAEDYLKQLTARSEKVRELKRPARRRGAHRSGPGRGRQALRPRVQRDHANLRGRRSVAALDPRSGYTAGLPGLEGRSRQAGALDVTIHVKGRSDRDFTGKVRVLPSQNAATVPVQLTQRGGGPLAVKPGGDPNVLVPLAQVYLVEVEMLDPDAAIDPGQLAVVKVHTKWRSGAWWVGRALANAMDIGFY